MIPINVYQAAGFPPLSPTWQWRFVSGPYSGSAEFKVCNNAPQLYFHGDIVSSSANNNTCSGGTLIIEIDDPNTWGGQYIFDLEQTNGTCQSTHRAILELVHVGIDAVPDYCYYTMCIESLGDSGHPVTQGQWSNTTPQNAQCRQWQYRRLITSPIPNDPACIDEIPSQDRNVVKTVDEDCSGQPLQTGLMTHQDAGCTFTISNGAYVDELYLADYNNGNPIQRGLDLSGVIYAGNLSQWADDIRAAIIAQLQANPWNYVQGTEFSDVEVEAPTTDLRDFRIWMGCKHNPTGRWVGIDIDDSSSTWSGISDIYYDGVNGTCFSYPTIRTPQTLVDGVGTPPIKIIESYPLPVCNIPMTIEMEIETPYTQIIGTACCESSWDFINPNFMFNYNTLKPLNVTPTIKPNIEIVIDQECVNDAVCPEQLVDLYATVNNPYGQQQNLTYQWSNGATTNFISVVTGSGTYTVNVQIPMPSGTTPTNLTCQASITV
jgi:hypothetical protein